MISNKRSTPLSAIITLTLISITAQIVFFINHSHASKLVENLIHSSIADNLFHLVVLMPIIKFLLLQVIAYVLFIALIWFIAAAWSKPYQYECSVFFWIVASVAVLSLNQHYFPDSFFTIPILSDFYNTILMTITVLILLVGVIKAYYQLVKQCRPREGGNPLNRATCGAICRMDSRLRGNDIFVGAFFLLLTITIAITSAYTHFNTKPLAYHQTKPNIIIIGLDSLRPDFTGYYGNHSVHTPHIDAFLQSAVTFDDAYTPLARTFPSWASILTARHPKHSHARINLSDPSFVAQQDTLAKRLQQAGYETIYATDEKRFSNITKEYGFNQILGPGMGLSDFLLGGLSDFPLTNLMINLPFGRYLFPYNYGNRAAAVTYAPDSFLQMLKIGLHQRRDQPLLLAVHFCVTHWPYTWARDRQGKNFTQDQRYRSSIEQVDRQLGALMVMLQENGLLEHSLVILLSDHGTTLGLPGDRLITKQHYQGDPNKLKWVTVNKLNTASDLALDIKHDFVLNTSYGQGTDVLSLKQYHVLFAFKASSVLPTRFLRAERVYSRVSLLDVTPTILAYLHLPPMNNVDGISLMGRNSVHPRPFYLETGYSITEIETNKIDVEKVVAKTIHMYEINPENGNLFIKHADSVSELDSKQRAVLLGDWLLARYPATQHNELGKDTVRNKRQPAYYVLANVKTGLWTIGFSSALAKSAPLGELRRKFTMFYGDEL